MNNKPMYLVSGLAEGYWDSDCEEFLIELEKALVMLDTLGQIQAAAGGVAMQGKSEKTFSTQARLERYSVGMRDHQNKRNETRKKAR